jgi:hypothetical protein
MTAARHGDGGARRAAGHGCGSAALRPQGSVDDGKSTLIGRLFVTRSRSSKINSCRRTYQQGRR